MKRLARMARGGSQRVGPPKDRSPPKQIDADQVSHPACELAMARVEVFRVFCGFGLECVRVMCGTCVPMCLA